MTWSMVDLLARLHITILPKQPLVTAKETAQDVIKHGNQSSSSINRPIDYHP